MPLFEGAIFSVERRDGRDVVVHAPAVAIVAVDRDEHVTLVRQRRVPAGGPVLELPAGLMDSDEAPLVAARRELAEETGLRGGEWVEIATFFTSPGFTDERLHLFLATGLVAGLAQPEEDEQLELVRVPLAEIPSLIEECEDGKTLVGLLFLARYRGL